MTIWMILGVALASAAVSAVVAVLVTRYRDAQKVSYMMDALEDGELNFRFQEKSRMNRALNRFRTIFERRRSAHEQDSWTKLIRVLTHEIMNTVTPIATLSDALSKSMDEQGRSELDVKAGLETIADASQNLIRFVQNYRQLSGVARPIRQRVVVREWIERVIALNSEYLTSCCAACTYRSDLPALELFADEGQLSQIVINLIKNALQARATQIDLCGRSGVDGEVVLTVSNNGDPISAAAQEQIFVPFFTTKQEGSGIGLSLSREIMRRHNGTIELLKSNPHETVFVLTFR